MSFNHDYQNGMTPDAKYLDQEGEKAAEGTTVQNSKTHEETVVTHHDGGTYKRDEGVMGMLPAQPLPLDHAIHKSLEFKRMAGQTDANRVTLTGSRKQGGGAAFNSQLAMANNYDSDVGRLSESQREYDMFAPLGNLATQSYAKMQKVGSTIGIDEGFELSKKENEALNHAGRAKLDHTAMLVDGDGHSMKAASDKVSSARNRLLGASEHMSALLKGQALKSLEEELAKEKEDKEKIEAKIEKVAQLAGFIDKAGSFITGAGGLAQGLAAGAPVPEEVVDLRPEQYGKAKEVGEKVSKGGGMIERAAKLGATIYYADKIAEIQGRINTVAGMIPAVQKEIASAEWKSAEDNLVGASQDYGGAVAAYQTVVSSRRDTMGAIGNKADQEVDAKGGAPEASQAMVWTATAMETQSFVEQGLSAGERAHKTVNQAESTIVKHRTTGWGTLSDSMEASNTPRKEGLGGPDVKAIKEMAHLVNWWMQGAAKVKKQVDQQVEKKARENLKTVGYTGSY